MFVVDDAVGLSFRLTRGYRSVLWLGQSPVTWSLGTTRVLQDQTAVYWTLAAHRLDHYGAACQSIREREDAYLDAQGFGDLLQEGVLRLSIWKESPATPLDSNEVMIRLGLE